MKYVKAIPPEPVPVQHEVILTDQEIRTIRKIVGRLGGTTNSNNIALGLNKQDAEAAESLYGALAERF